MLGVPLWLAAVLGALLLLGAACFRLALKIRVPAPPSGAQPAAKSWADVWLALGNACIAGGALTIAVFLIQQTVISERDMQVRLLTTSDLSGMDLGPSDDARGQLDGDSTLQVCREPDERINERDRLKDHYLAAKTLDGARFDGMNLKGARFEHASLRGASFICAILDGAQFDDADLSSAHLEGARLSSTDLRGASLYHATLPPTARWGSGKEKVSVNAATCWPKDGKKEIWTFRGLIDERRLKPLQMGDPDKPAFRRAFGHRCTEDRVWLPGGRRPPVRAASAPVAHAKPATPPAPGERDIVQDATQDAAGATERELIAALRDLTDQQRDLITTLAERKPSPQPTATPEGTVAEVTPTAMPASTP